MARETEIKVENIWYCRQNVVPLHSQKQGFGTLLYV